MKRLRKVGIWLVASAVLVLGIVFADFYAWRSGIIEEIEADPDRRIVTTALGEVEFAIDGKGVPMLMLHGSIGGYDNALNMGGEIPNTMKIGVSRPGYLGTPISSGRTHQEQADLFAALLDELGIEKVFVYAASAGGRFGMQFALRHPDRTLGLVLVSTGLGSASENDVPELSRATLFLGDIYMWATTRLFPSLLASTLTATFDRSDPTQVDQIRSVAATMVPMSSRWPGNVNDATQAANPEIEDWPLGENSVPTLILHGDADPLTSYANALAMNESIALSQLHTIEGGGHGVFTAEQRQRTTDVIESFMRSIN